MKKEDSIIAICLVLTIFLVGIIVYEQRRFESLLDEYTDLANSLQALSEEEVFALSEDNVRREVWQGFNNDGVGESSFADYRFKMWINDTSGGWALSKISRGLMPHGWGLRYAPVNEIELTRQNPPNVTLDITLKLIDFRNYTATNSSMNVAICLFFDGCVVEYQEASYQTEIQFFSYYGDRIQTGQIWNFSWRNNSVTQVKLADNLSKGEIRDYEMNITPYILGMMSHYGLSRIKLKHIEIFTEAYAGYSEFELYHAKITAIKNVTIR
jgi:hypothetical protein